jgi:hypothetical protein
VLRADLEVREGALPWLAPASILRGANLDSVQVSMDRGSSETPILAGGSSPAAHREMLNLVHTVGVGIPEGVVLDQEDVKKQALDAARTNRNARALASDLAQTSAARDEVRFVRNP